jgi:uncharacterized BrkB/YihY/UPF0761 family membrane protein
MTNENNQTFPRPWMGWVALLLLVLAGLLMVIIPVWVIMPFKAQTERGMELSYGLKRWSPMVTLVGSVAALGLAVWLWPRARRWWRKAALVVVLIPLLAATWFARQNHFEWMFSQPANASYAVAGEAGFVADAEMVLAVERNGEAVAYPVRLMAYHHIVQDTVGGTPIVATY